LNLGQVTGCSSWWFSWFS